MDTKPEPKNIARVTGGMNPTSGPAASADAEKTVRVDAKLGFNPSRGPVLQALSNQPPLASSSDGTKPGQTNNAETNALRTLQAKLDSSPANVPKKSE